MNQYKNLEKPKYCKYCDHKSTVRNWSVHINTKKHKHKINNTYKQIPITNFIKLNKKT